MSKHSFLTLASFGLAATIFMPEAARADDSDGFILPSGNIACLSYSLSAKSKPESPFLRCEIVSKLNPMPPKAKSCGFDWGNGFLLTTAAKKAEVLCVGDMIYSPNYPKLSYGKTWKKNGFTCKATSDGLNCRNGKGNGFFLSIEKWKVF